MTWNDLDGSMVPFIVLKKGRGADAIPRRCLCYKYLLFSLPNKPTTLNNGHLRSWLAINRKRPNINIFWASLRVDGFQYYRIRKVSCLGIAENILGAEFFRIVPTCSRELFDLIRCYTLSFYYFKRKG